jgi:N-acetylglucosaminyldiphosphoundecaprenol N-acetyl-beta-D-mannosaminyltransferase
MQSSAQRISLLGIRLTPFDLPAAVAEMAQAVAEERPTYASTCPVYTLMQGHERPAVRAALNGADWVTPDGMPVVWALRLLGARTVGRVYGPDLMLALSALSAQRGYSQYYLGGQPGVAADLAQELQRKFPGLAVAGLCSPPFSELTAAAEDSLLEIVWVGLGSPKQDLWMARFRPRLRAPLLVGVGAAFDFFTGRQRQAPRWMQRSGMEWLFRFVSQPKRLWRRYLIYNPKFLMQFGLQLAGLRRYD